MSKEEFFQLIKKASVVNKEDKILELCQGKKVLDVGCIGQDKNIQNRDWLHGKIFKVSKELIGTDINTDLFDELRKHQFQIYTPEELAKLSMLFDVIVIADVIEHVNNPVDLLRMYATYLNPTGIIIITTPNAVSARNFTHILFGNFYSVNPEHTFWFCPKTILETIERAGLKYVEFFWMKEYYSFKDSKGVFSKTLYILDLLLLSLRKLFHPNFMLIIKKPKDD